MLDAQVHVWEPATSRPWNPRKPVIGSAPFEAVLAAMDAVGVAAAVLYPSMNYRTLLSDGSAIYDNSYAEEAAITHPNRFASVATLDPLAPGVKLAVALARDRPGTLGVRVVVHEPQVADFVAGRYGGFFEAAAEQSVPVFVYATGHLKLVAQVATEFPGLRLAVDHIGIPQGPNQPRDDPPFSRLPELLQLARFPNVSVKLSGVPTLSETTFPFPDVFPYLRQVVDAFGVERLMWGSDYTRCRPLHTYAEALHYLLHSDDFGAEEKAWLFGRTLRRFLEWRRP